MGACSQLQEDLGHCEEVPTTGSVPGARQERPAKEEHTNRYVAGQAPVERRSRYVAGLKQAGCTTLFCPDLLEAEFDQLLALLRLTQLEFRTLQVQAVPQASNEHSPWNVQTAFGSKLELPWR